ncbi:hypothetical protein BJ742DRAFT_838548 [Cladochytrium replicatum]|nr:hypothetical protein BJ742DRAFT_838548 [Cladochytrium replicatum]
MAAPLPSLPANKFLVSGPDKPGQPAQPTWQQRHTKHATAGGTTMGSVIAPATSKRRPISASATMSTVNSKMQRAKSGSRSVLQTESNRTVPMVQTICLDLITSGHIHSYIEFFKLVLVQRRIAPDDDNLDPDALHRFKDLLIASEDANRAGEQKQIYTARKHIGDYFLGLKLYDVAVRHFVAALDVARHLSSHTRIEIEATGNLGRVLELHGRAQEALEYYEQSRRLSREFQVDDGDTSRRLIQVRTLIADKMSAEGRYADALGSHLMCLEILQQSFPDDHALASEICFRLGEAYRHVGDIANAVKFLELHLERCRELGDPAKEGAAQGALAACFAKSGNLDLAVGYLKNFVALTEHDPLQTAAHSDAYYRLGALYNKMKNYGLAVECFERHYALVTELEIAKRARQDADDGENFRADGCGMTTLGTAQAQLGIARGNRLMETYIEAVSGDVGKLLKWKASLDPSVF